MEDKDKKGDSIEISIGGDNPGMIAIGTEITQTQNLRPPTDDELAELKRAFADLRAQVQGQALPEMREAAIAQVDELEKAVHADEPDISTMEKVKNWFMKNIPVIAGSVTSVVLSPIVGKLVGVAGDALATEFKRRFGVEDEGS